MVRINKVLALPEVVCINQPPDDLDLAQKLPLMQPPDRQPKSDTFPESHRLCREHVRS